MEINFDVLPVIILWVLLLFGVYILLYRKFIYSIIDPLFIWVSTTAFASVLVIEVVPDIIDVLHFFGCQLCLWIGFFIAYRTSGFETKTNFQLQRLSNFSGYGVLRWLTYILLSIYVISNLYIAYSKGFALLSDAPSESKVANFQEGFGIFRKINWSLGTFTSTSLVFLFLSKRRRIDLVCLTIVVLFTSLEGSKGALLQIAISVGVVFYHPAFSEQRQIFARYKRFAPLAFIGIMGVFFTVLFKENDGVDEAFFAFIRRLLYSADSVLYFYLPVNIDYFSTYQPLDYISHIVNPILGFFRLQPYQEALGNTMVDNLRPPGSTSTVTVGPNTPFYIDGRIYFGYFLAFPYSVLIGYLYAIIRIHFFSLLRTTAFYFVFMGSFCHLASAIITDINLAVTQLFDLSFFVIPAFVVISFSLTRKLVIPSVGIINLVKRYLLFR